MDRADRIRRNRQNSPDQNDDESSGEDSTVAIVLGVLGHAGLLGGGLFFLPLMFSFMGTPLPPVLVLALFAVIIGIIPAYLLRNSISFKSYSVVGVTESCVIAIMSGFNAAIYTAFQRLQQFHQELSATNQTAGSLGGSSLGGRDSIALANTDAAVHPEIFFITVFILFNAPFCYYYVQRRDTDWRYVALYLLPILLYLGMRFILPGLLSGGAIYNLGGGL